MGELVPGPFQAFTGRVEEVAHYAWKLRVRVSIFARGELIELKFLDIEKLRFTEEE
ncbi:MAG: hypothetical protein LC775_06895 [Acidobacteria bacterium]|nr:hypothetical protein [Acidobacteriota bacterium]